MNDNTALGTEGRAGGIESTEVGTLTLIGSTVTRNAATRSPGGIEANPTTTTITDSVVVGNTPTNCLGTDGGPIPGCAG